MHGLQRRSFLHAWGGVRSVQRLPAWRHTAAAVLGNKRPRVQALQKRALRRPGQERVPQVQRLPAWGDAGRAVQQARGRRLPPVWQ